VKASFHDPRTKELVFEDPVQVNDGLVASMSAVVQFDPRCGSNFIGTFMRLQSAGYIKLKTVRVAKKRDWIRP